MKKLSELKAVIFDLDGVITNTAKIHAEAWKEMFDSFMRDYTAQRDISFSPMDERDYKMYVDGRPRYEGAQKFLLSRGIDLPYGSADNDVDTQTVCGLANRKNMIYLNLLNEQGAEAYEDTIDLIKKLRLQSKKTAVISASTNCREVLALAGITGLFNAVVDGMDSKTYHLRGKPEPDIFLFAAKLLQVEPSEAAIVEDAIAGVEAGKKGSFALVIGISRNGGSSLLFNSGADIIVSSLNGLSDTLKGEKKPFSQLPDALQEIKIWRTGLKKNTLLLLLDYDGTLTPIVSRPELALLSDTTREILRSLSRRVKVAVVSGRDLSDVKKLVGLEGICYAGSHGLEIEGADLHFELDSAKTIVPDLDRVEDDLRRHLLEINGVILERKKYSLAVHYRLVTKKDELARINEIIEKSRNRFEKLKLIYGKMVVEIRPRMEWDKGNAVVFLADKLAGKRENVFPVYIGDDLTDEDAFREVKGWGIGVLVGNHGCESYADYRLSDTGAVLQFLKFLLKIVG